MSCLVFQPGMVAVECHAAEDVLAAQREALLALRAEASPLALVLDARGVELPTTTLNFWLEQLDALGPTFQAVAVVSPRPRERLAVGAFGLAASLRHTPLRVGLFETLEQARTWARRVAQAATGTRTAESLARTSAAD